MLNGLIEGGTGRQGRQACHFSAAHSEQRKAVPDQKSWKLQIVLHTFITIGMPTPVMKLIWCKRKILVLIMVPLIVPVVSAECVTYVVLVFL